MFYWMQRRNVYTLLGGEGEIGYGPTEDGKSLVVWDANFFNIFPADSIVSWGSGEKIVYIHPNGEIVNSAPLPTDPIKLPGSITDYGWGPTEDGQGMIVWKGDWYKIFPVGGSAQFADGSVSISDSGLISSSDGTTLQTYPTTQAVGASTDYGWGPTEDGQGMVVWKGDWFQIFDAGSTVKFADGTVTIGTDLKIVADVNGIAPQPSYPVTEITSTSTDYGWGPTEDGKGMVVWKGDWFQIFDAGSTVKFADGTVTIGTDLKIVADVNGIAPQPSYPVTQVAAASTDYGWGPTEDGQGMVIWKGDWFQIFDAGSTVKFADGSVTVGTDHTITTDIDGVAANGVTITVEAPATAMLELLENAAMTSNVDGYSNDAVDYSDTGADISDIIMTVTEHMPDMAHA